MQGIDPVSTDEFVFFDFQSNIDEVNNLKIYTDDKGYSFKSKLTDKFIGDTNDTIFVYTVEKMYSYFELQLDVTFFINKENGIIGSFVTPFQDKKHITQKRGRLFPERIDYSKFTNVRLQ